MSRGLLFGTNWKMHKTIREASDYASRFRDLLATINGIDDAFVFVIPPYTAINGVRSNSMGKFHVGAQNMHSAEWGAFTGEISAPMLKELGVDLVQVGHAERRQLFHETDPTINQKVRTALRYQMRPLVCIGEDEVEHDFRVEKETVARQLRMALHEVSDADVSQVIVAYEPVWAIGDSGVTAEPDYVREMILFCRNLIADMFNSARAEEIAIIYGGSVNNAAAPRFLLESLSDGVFVGRAALDAKAFAELIRICLQTVATDSTRGDRSGG